MKQCTCYALRAIDCTCKPAKYGELYTSPPAKQEQGEPVAWMMHNSSGDEISITESNLRHHQPAFVQDLWKDSTPLYTTPQQRTWVGLTLEERDHLWEVSRAGLPRYNTFAGLVESKLKEKNSA